MKSAKICFYCLCEMATVGEFVLCPKCGYAHPSDRRKVRKDKGGKKNGRNGICTFSAL